MSSPVHIAIDAMGGDLGPRLCVSAALKFLNRYKNVQLTLVGEDSLLRALLPPLYPQAQLKIHSATDQVSMAEKPSLALRHKRDSSMAHAVRMVADGHAHACVSSGNTGALMAFGLHMIGTPRGVDRPAICKAIPTRKGVCWILDLGANIECSAENFRQFSLMGRALAQLHGIAAPRVGILNVGTEPGKGRELEQLASVLIEQQKEVNFIGFVEGSDIYHGQADVVVCDGFTGNIFLKASEGVASFLQDSLVNELRDDIRYKMLGWLLRPLFGRWAKQHSPALLNGASFLGLNGIVVKSHGAASEQGFLAALQVAYDQSSGGIVDAIAAAVAP